MTLLSINKGQAFLVIEKIKDGEYQIVDNTVAVKGGNRLYDQTAIGFKHWDSTVEDLDKGDSDISQIFKMSDHLRWGDVILTTKIIRATNIEDIKKALRHVAVVSYCPGDI